MQSNQQQWQRVNAWRGGTITGVAFSPDFMNDRLALAATPAGIYRSTDGGQQWAWSSAGISEPLVMAVGFAPTSGDTPALAFASTQGGRLFRSTDGGAAWSEVTAWAGFGVISSLLFSPAFAVDQTFFATTEAGVFRTQDGGAHWESSTFGLHDLQTLCLACAPAFVSGENSPNEVLWVGTAAGGFYRSRNAGRSWRDAGAGLPDDAVACLLISPHFASDRTLYVGTESAGLYHSTDGGANWALLNAELAEASATALIMTAKQRLLLGTGAGIYGSDDGGKTWLPAIGGAFVVTALALADDGTLLAGALHSGIYRSSDGGKSWQSANAGLVAHVPPLIWRGAQQRLIALDNQGWLACGQTAGEWITLNHAENAGALTAYALVDGAAVSTIFATDAAGQLWRTMLPSDEPGWEVVATALHSEQTFTTIVAAPRAGQQALLYLGDQAGQVYCWDQEVTLQPIIEQVPWAGESLLHLAVSPYDPTGQALLAVSTRRGATGHYRLQLWESPNGGQSWNGLAALVTEIPAVAVAWPLDPAEQAIFLATRHRVIKLFFQGEGRTLASTQSFLDTNLNITALVASVTFVEDRTLWAATTRGVYQSSDGGVTWQALGAGLAERNVVALLPPTATTPLQAVTLGGEVWEVDGG